MAFDTDRSARAILDELSKHPHDAGLTELVHTLAVSAFDERRTGLDVGMEEAASRIGVDEAGAGTSHGNVIRALKKRGAASGQERTLLGALVARGVAKNPPSGLEAERRVAETLAWLSSHTVADPLSALEPALLRSNAAAGLFAALAEVVRAHDEGRADSLDRPSALVAAFALARATIEPAIRSREELAQTVSDPTLAAIVALPPADKAGSAAQLVVSGEETAPPRGSVLTFLLTVTFVLPLLGLAKLFGRFALRLRRPTEMSFTKDGVTVKSRVEVLGKTVRERETFLAASSLVRAAREVRYPRLATYVGIACLLVGSYFGLRFALYGVKGGSPELLALGLGILVVALALDYALSLLPARTPNHCRIVLEPRRGRVLAVTRVEKTKADAALQTLRAS